MLKVLSGLFSINLLVSWWISLAEHKPAVAEKKQKSPAPLPSSKSWQIKLLFINISTNQLQQKLRTTQNPLGVIKISKKTHIDELK
jgi:hypothetical protein